MKELNSFYSSTLDVIRTGDILQLESHMSLLKEMIQKGIEQSENPDKSNILRTLDNYFNDFIAHLIERKEYIRICEYLFTFYKMVQTQNAAKSATSKYTFYLENSIKQLLLKVEKDTVENKKIVLGNVLLILHLMFKEGRQSTIFFYSMLYNLLENLRATSEISKREINQFIQDIIDLRMDAPSDRLDLIKLHINIILRIFHTIIHRGNSNRFSELIKAVYENLVPFQKKYEQIIISMVVYLYYLSFREDAVSSERHSEYKEFLTDSSSGVNLQTLFTFFSPHFWDFYLQTKGNLGVEWEEWGEDQKVKTFNLDSIIDEFFILITIHDPRLMDAIQHNIPTEIFTENNVFRFLQYFDLDNLKASYKEYLWKLEKWIYGNLNEDLEIIANSQRFSNFLLELYKNFEFDKLLEFWSNNQILEDAKKIVIQGMKEDAKQNGFFQIADCKSTNNIKVFTLKLPIAIFPIQSDLVKGYIQRGINYHIFDYLSKNGVESFSLPFSHEGIYLEELLRKVKMIKPNIFVFADLHQYRLQYIQDKSLTEELEALEIRMRKVSNTNTNFSVYFNQDLIEINFGSNFSVTLRQPTKDEINKQLRTAWNVEKQKFYIPVVNDIRIPCSEDEAIYYLIHGDIILESFMEFDVRIQDPAGALIVKY